MTFFLHVFCFGFHSEFGFEKENKEPATEKVLKSCLKRPRAETLPVKTIGRRSVRMRRCESPSPVNPVFQSPEPSVPDSTPICDKPQAAQKAVTPNHGAVLDSKPVASSGDTKAVDCKQSMADESFSPSGIGEDHFSLRLEKQGKESTIRKRLSTRLVHVPNVGEDSHVASGYRKDSATATTPIVFLTSMPNDPKKRALAQVCSPKCASPRFRFQLGFQLLVQFCVHLRTLLVQHASY